MVDRRTVLGAAGAMGLGLAAGQAVQAQTAQPMSNRSRKPFDPLNPQHNAYGYAKIHGSLDGRATYTFSTGYIVGFLPGELPQQLTGFDQVKVNRMVDNGDGTYTDIYATVYMFTEIDKHALLDRWTNPYTGRENQPFHYRSGPSRTLITPEGFKSAKKPDGPGRPDPFVLPWLIMGDSIFYRMNSASWFPSALDPEEWKLEAPGEQMISSFLLTSNGSLAEMEDPDAPMVHATDFTNAHSNWLPWMLMGQIPGSIAYHVVGERYYERDKIPTEVIANAEQVYPGFFEDPLNLPYTLQFIEYKNKRTPAF